MASFGLRHGKSSKCNSLNSPVLLKKYSRSQKLRAEALGWDGWKKESFEANQSLMNSFQYISPEEKEKMEAVSESGLNVVSCDNEKISKQSCLQSSSNTCETSLLSDNFLMCVPNLSSSILFESNSPYLSTSKAIFTILLPSSQILVVNSAACQLINYSSDELCSMKLENLVHESYKHKLLTLQENFLKDSNQVPLNNGKLLEIVGKDGDTILVSLYLKKIDSPQRCLAIAEPLDRKIGVISVDQNGKILSYDEDVAVIFQYDASELVGVNIHTLLPAINLSKDNENQSKKVSKQKITGRTKNREAFPVCLTVSCGNPSSEVYQIMIWAYTGLSGLILLNKSLSITNFNHYFIKLLFGFSKKDITSKHITNLIPTFCKDVKLERNKKSQNGISKLVNDSHFTGTGFEKIELYQESSRNGVSIKDDFFNNLKSSAASFSLNNYSHCSQLFGESYLDLQAESGNDAGIETLFPMKIEEKNEETKTDDYTLPEMQHDCSEGKSNICSQVVKSSNHSSSLEESQENDKTGENFVVQEGKFLGYGKHSDGTYIDIRYQVKIAALSDDVFYCIWLSRDLRQFGDTNRGLSTNATMASSFNSTSFDGSLPKDSVCSGHYTRPSTASIISQCDEILTAGEYCEYYTNIRQIGKGAFGYVKMAFRNSDGLLVVTKFIKKQKIHIRSWVFDSNLNMKIPLEISLLTTLQHPNIVKVLDIFHNDYFFQLVMEKHGAGFDLFEFIDRRPKCDEKLKSYIFRQIISAVHYLDSLGILHRDIKDENVIINEKFEVKLIDFGSATFMSPDETFSKFYGTVEYCSPEVLQGNTYKGPELEIWALGVTLYVLTFGENPFYDIEETIKGQFSIPSPISTELNDLLHQMLDKNVQTRITIDRVVQDLWINQPVSIENYRFEEVVRCYDEEAYPPKYVSEIRTDELYSRRDSKGDSDHIGDTNNSYSSLQNLPVDDLGDIDDNFQEVHKSTNLEPFVQRKNISSIVLSSTPVQKRNDRLCKSAIGLRKRFDNSLAVYDHGYECFDNNPVPNDFNMELSLLKQFTNSSPSLIGPDVAKEEVVVPVFDDNKSGEVELKVCFKRCSIQDDQNPTRKESSENEDSRTISQDSFEDGEENVCEEYLIAEDKSGREYSSPD